MPSAQDIRKAILERWHAGPAGRGGLFQSDSVSGSSPPSVFVGSHGYPRVSVGPMVPQAHGDTSLLDSPERWAGMTLEEIVGFRLGLVRGIRRIRAGDTGSRYVGDLQEVAMSSRPVDSDLRFSGAVSPSAHVDGESAPFGPAGEVRDARFSASPPSRAIERAYYDRDLGSADAVVGLYRSGIDVTRIQRCLSIGMLGRRRRLVPTRWSIAATDDTISRSLVGDVLDMPEIDSHAVFTHAHLGNAFSVVLFPHRWVFEMTEAWHSGGAVGFGSDCEDARGLGHPPSIAGAYFAARLGVAEYLAGRGVQAGALVLREIRPEYAVPVGVWQVREGVRLAMASGPREAGGLDEALDVAAGHTSVSKAEWLARGSVTRLLRQRRISEYT